MNEAEQAAYIAGKHSATIVWPDDPDESSVPVEKQVPGVHHCPFSKDQQQERQAWLRGLEDALGGDRFDPATIVREIHDELEGGDDVGA
jgi:hypothetical protein